MRSADVLVVGAGITGAAAAFALAEAGARVTVLDTYGPAAMASGWTLAGVRQSGRHPAELPLARAAVAEWPHLSERLGAPTYYRQEGNLRLARDADEVAVIEDLVARQTAAGLDLAFLSTNADVRAVAPAIAESVLAASFCATDGHADPIATVDAFLSAAARGGAQVEARTRVTGFRQSGGRVTHVFAEGRRIAVGAVVLAAGVGINKVLRPLGASIPLRIPIVTVVRTAPLPPLLKQVLGVANADLAVRQEAGGALRLTSGAEPFAGSLVERGGRPHAAPRAGQVAETIARVSAVLPVLADAEFATAWGGLLDLTPDALPVIDLVPGYDNVVVAAGFSGHGFGIGPVTGRLAADLALGRPPEFDLDAFRFDRLDDEVGEAAALTLHG